MRPRKVAPVVLPIEGTVGILGWRSVGTFMLMAARPDGYSLAITVAPDLGLGEKWPTLAIESSTRDMAGVLDNHAHELLGTFGSPGEAMQAAERYATRWLKRRPAALCSCEDIAPSKKRTVTPGPPSATLKT